MLLIVGETMAEDAVVFSVGLPATSYQVVITSALLSEAFRKNDVKFSLKSYPNIRSMKMANSGRSDGELTRVYDFHKVTGGKYPNLVRIDSQLMTVDISVFAKDASLVVKDWSDLNGLKIVYRRGRKKLESQLENITNPVLIFPAKTDKTAFLMTAGDRADVVISEVILGEILKRQYPELTNLQMVGTLYKVGIYAYMHKKHTALSKQVGETLEAMKKDGSFGEITERAINKLYSKSTED